MGAKIKQTPLEMLDYTLHQLGLSDHIASKNLLEELSAKRFSGLAVEAVTSLLTLVRDKQKEQIKGELLGLADSLDARQSVV